jgi:S-DNA-T family DNA segregation ATPase FtsK/SpoIIIE
VVRPSNPFKELPHVVDFVTNLRGNAVARMFAAIIAELNRRQQVNQDTDMKDIVRYKRAGLHLQRQDNYPHLFIIIDEFAEMISNNAEYKAQLDSITRLGRALGVSLILAAQRPTGVTDQMRANIKFRIALRVETRDESSELLRLPDAAYLPSIPGRGYMQVGSESLENIQVGYTGEPYVRDDYDPMERYEGRDIIWEEDLGKEEDEPTYDVMVRRMARWAKERYGDNPPWRKPWPNPLPTYLSLDQPAGIEVEYVRDEDQDFIRGELAPNQPFVLAPAIPQWLDGQLSAWKPMDWENRAMRAVVGLIDDPSNAKLQLLKVDLTVGHYTILGASGWGKSIFLRTVVTSLLATHSPDDLNLYILDFGSRALQIFEDVTHTGAYIVSHEKERVERLIRMLDELNDSRKEIISQANVANLLEYNHKGPPRGRTDLPAKIPAVLVIIDNFAEFRNTYESQFELLTSLVREGLSNGIYFIVSGEQSNALGKLFNLIPERITLKLSDDGEYSTIVGRGARPVDEIAGRGLRRVDRSPLELQVALPLGFIDDEAAKTEAERLIDFLAILKKAAQDKNYKRPPQIDILENWAVLPYLLKEYRDKLGTTPKLPAQIIIGRSDSDLMPTVLALDAKPHFIVTGPPSSGKSTALHTWILSLADLYSPREIAMVMVDYQGGIVDYGGTHRLDELPHALMPVITEPQQFGEMVTQLENEFIYTPDRPYREVFVIFDNYDDIDELASKVEGGDPRRRLGDMARRLGKQGLHFIVCGMKEGLTSGDDMLRPISANRYGLAMDSETAESAPFYGSVPRSYSQMQLPRGRGFIVTPGKVALVQVAVPYPDPTRKTEDMDAWVETILDRGDERAAWLPLAPKPDATASANGSSNGTQMPTALTADQRLDLLTKIAEKMGATADMLATAFPDDESLVNTALSYGITL